MGAHRQTAVGQTRKTWYRSSGPSHNKWNFQCVGCRRDAQDQSYQDGGAQVDHVARLLLERHNPHRVYYRADDGFIRKKYE